MVFEKRQNCRDGEKNSAFWRLGQRGRNSSEIEDFQGSKTITCASERVGKCLLPLPKPKIMRKQRELQCK